jgi:hypothetical protein
MTQTRSTERKLLQKLYAQFYFIDFSLLQGEKVTLLMSRINIPLEEALLIMTERMEYGLWFGSLIRLFLSIFRETEDAVRLNFVSVY